MYSQKIVFTGIVSTHICLQAYIFTTEIIVLLCYCTVGEHSSDSKWKNKVVAIKQKILEKLESLEQKGEKGVQKMREKWNKFFGKVEEHVDHHHKV